MSDLAVSNAAPVRKTRRRIRLGALSLGALALGFYVAFIALTFYRGHR